MARQSALPLSLPPRLVSRKVAAAYLSISEALFNKMVQAGKMPRPKRLTEGRLAWDVREIDWVIDQMALDSDASCADQTWSDVDAPEAAASR